MNETTIALSLMFGVMVIGIGTAIYFGKKGGKVLAAKVAAAKVIYDQALDELEQDPSNSSKYQKAMSIGRDYYALGNRRGDPQIQNVIEQRLASDLNARTLKVKGKSS